MRRWLCSIGLHSFKHIFGERHWHVQCRRCGRREVWRNHNPSAGYQPIMQTWPRDKGPTADEQTVRNKLDELETRRLIDEAADKGVGPLTFAEQKGLGVYSSRQLLKPRKDSE